MCAVLACGPVFDATSTLGDDGYLYGWLDALLTSRSEQLQTLTESTLALLLEYNTDTPQLLDWLIDRCYTTPARVADKCFRALAAVFAQREYPCECTAMLTLALMYSTYPFVHVQQMAVELLQLLEQRFLVVDGGNAQRTSVIEVITHGGAHQQSPQQNQQLSSSADSLDHKSSPTASSTSPGTAV